MCFSGTLYCVVLENLQNMVWLVKNEKSPVIS